jgi:hypothetical protein
MSTHTGTLPRKRHTFDIFGTCATLHAFCHPATKDRVVGDNAITMGFHADRQSIVSAMTPPLETDVNTLEYSWKTNLAYAKRLANVALNKPFFKRLEQGSKPSEYLILDCTAEYFDVSKIGACVIDDGPAKDWLVKGKGAVFQSKESYMQESADEYKKIIKAFCERLLKYYPEKKIIINRVFFKNEYVQDGAIKSMDKKTCLKNEHWNFLLAYHYEQVLSNLPNATVFEMPPKTIVAYNYPFNPPGAVFGIHFEMDFYLNFYEKFYAKIKQDEDAEREQSLLKLNLQLKEAQVTIDCLNHSLERKDAELRNALARVQRYHSMSKDPAISLYRKLRRTLGTWYYS